MSEALKLRKRNEIPDEFKWHINDIFSSDEAWEAAFEDTKTQIQSFLEFMGHLGDSQEIFWDCMKKNEEISLIISKLYVFANMKFHEDGTNPKYQAFAAKSESIAVEYSSYTSFIVPEILTIPEDKLWGFVEKRPEYAYYKHFIENLLRNKAHTLSPKEEELLAKSGEMAVSFQTIFTMYNDADIKFPEITDEDGNKIELTKGNYITFMESSSRDVRKAAFEALYDTYLKHKNTLAAIYSSSVKKDIFYSSVRNYSSALEAAVDEDNIPVSVYESLIEAVHKKINLLHRYVALRKKILGLDKINAYDLYAPLVPDLKMEKTYEEAKERVLEGLAPMGDEYISNLKMAMSSGWIDVYENEGKRSGAYSWGVYSVHPFVLLNHNNNINSMFTIAHELGHALHSYYTWENMPYLYSGHKIFVAEVASTVNEALLISDMLEKSSDKKERMYLLNYFMDQFKGTLFRQTMFAEFEKTTHELVEAGEMLTCESLNKIYRDLNLFYFGEDIEIDSRLDLEWARIPHFYEAFYVYQYATGYSAAIALSQKILKEGREAVDRYIDFLKKGDSEYSIDLLKGAGVDMTTSKPVEDALDVFEKLLDEMEELVN